MACIYQVLEIVYPNGVGADCYRMTVRSDESADPPRGLCSHRHRTKETASECREARRRMPEYLRGRQKR
jgi:hypothetical protein